jgi:hypothetical protein
MAHPVKNGPVSATPNHRGSFMKSYPLFVRNLSLTLVLSLTHFITACQSNKTAAPAPIVAPAAEKQGGVDGGGGDILQSTEYQVERAVNLAFKGSMGHVFYNLGLTKVEDPYVKRIMERMYNDQVGEKNWPKSQPVFQNLVATKYKLQKEGCKEEGGKSHAMGVDHFKLQETICVSTDTLRALPPEDLHEQIVGLFAHEFAHHFSFNEYDAVKFQTYIVHNLKELNSIPNEFSVDVPDTILQHKNLNPESGRQNFIFQQGKLVERNEVDPDLTACVLVLQLGPEFYPIDANEKKALPIFHLQAQSFQLKYLEVAGSTANFEEEYSTYKETQRGFYLNPRWSNGIYESSGAAVSTKDFPSGKTTIYSVYCYGKNMHLQDIKRAFGGVL